MLDYSYLFVSSQAIRKYQLEHQDIFTQITKYVLQEALLDENVKKNTIWKEWEFEHTKNNGIDLIAKIEDDSFIAILWFYADSNISEKLYLLENFLNYGFHTDNGQIKQIEKGIIISPLLPYSEVIRNLSLFGVSANKKNIIDCRSFLSLGIDWLGLQQSIDLYDCSSGNAYIDFEKMELYKEGKIVCSFVKKNMIQENKEKIIKATQEYFKHNDRGKLILPCGIENFIVSQVTEAITPPDGTILFFYRNTEMTQWAYKTYQSNAKDDFIACVFYEESEKKNIDHYLIDDPSFHPVSTSEEIIRLYREAKRRECRFVIFCAYQNSMLLSLVQAQFGDGIPTFDLFICCDAYLTIRNLLHDPDIPRNFIHFVTDPRYTICHNNSEIASKKKLYVTATPILFLLSDIQSIYNEIYGEDIFYLDFCDARQQKLTPDYEVIILPIIEQKWKKIGKKLSWWKDRRADLDLVCKTIGMHQGLCEKSLLVFDQESEKIKEIGNVLSKRVFCYCQSENVSKKLNKNYLNILGCYEDELKINIFKNINVEIEHIDREMEIDKKLGVFDAFGYSNDKNLCSILCNVNCLDSEARVVEPDTLVFFDTKREVFKVIPSIANLMNRVNGNIGKIVIPIVISKNEISDLDEFNFDSKAEGLWDILNAIRSYDWSLNDPLVFRKKIKIAISSESFAKGYNAFDVNLLRKMSEDFYEVVARVFKDRKYIEHFEYVTSGIIKDVKRSIGEFNEKKPHIFDSLSKSLRAGTYSGITDSEIIQMICFQMFSKPFFEYISNEGLIDNPIVEALDYFVEKFLKFYEKTHRVEEFWRVFAPIQQKIKYKKYRAEGRSLADSFYKKTIEGIFDEEKLKHKSISIPQDIIDFTLRGTKSVLMRHFKTDFNSEDIKVFDPFARNGEFIERLICRENNFISDEHFERKIQGGIFAQESNILSYYSSLIDIAHAIRDRGVSSKTLNNIAFVDSLEYMEEKSNTSVLPLFKELSDNKRIKALIKREKTRVIVSNLLFNFENFSFYDNEGKEYPKLDEVILEKSKKENVMKVSNIELVRALEMASNKIEEKGVIACVCSENFITSKSNHNYRKELSKLFSSIYVINLKEMKQYCPDSEYEDYYNRGYDYKPKKNNQSICILFLVKDKKDEENSLFYYDIKSNIEEEKRALFVKNLQDLSKIPFIKNKNNGSGVWEAIDESRECYIQLFDKDNGESVFTRQVEKGIFGIKYSGTYDEEDIFAEFERKNEILTLIQECKFDELKEKESKQPKQPEQFYFKKSKFSFEGEVSEADNLFLYIAQGKKKFGCIPFTENDATPDFEKNSSIYPLFYYDANGKKHSNIEDNALALAQKYCKDSSITKEDIFYYTYALFNHKKFLEKNKDARRNLHIVLSSDFKELSFLGRALAKLQLKPECKEKHTSIEFDGVGIFDDYYIPNKIRVSQAGDRIFYNMNITLTNIPNKVSKYEICGKTIIEYFIDLFEKKILFLDFQSSQNEDIFDKFCEIVKVAEKSVDLIEEINKKNL